MGRFDGRDKELELRLPKITIKLILSAIGMNSLFILVVYFEIIKTDLKDVIIVITFFFLGWGVYLLQKELKKYLKIKNGVKHS